MFLAETQRGRSCLRRRTASVRVVWFIKAAKETRYKGPRREIAVVLFDLGRVFLSFFFCGFYETGMGPSGSAGGQMQ